MNHKGGCPNYAIIVTSLQTEGVNRKHRKRLDVHSQPLGITWGNHPQESLVLNIVKN